MPETQTTDLDPRAVMLLPSNDPRRLRYEAAVAEQLRVDREAHAARLAAKPEIEPRVALRAAIEKHEAAARRLDQIRKAMPAADAAAMQARRAVEQAKEAVEAARANAAAYATAKALGTAGAAPPSLKDARANLTDAEDALEVAKAAAADLGKQHDDAQRALRYRQSDIDSAVAAVVRGDARTKALIEAYERARRHLADLRGAVELIARVLPYGERLALTSERIDASPSETRAAWERAIAQLETNPEAALPI
jgi:hypothetical protein